MNTTKLLQHNFITLKWQAILVFIICSIPHLATEPLWLSGVFLGAITYRMTADYFSFPPLSPWVLSILTIGCAVFLYGQSSFSTEFFVRCLLLFIILKYLEIHTLRDLKVIILCNFFLIFSVLVVIQELWVIMYLLIAILANLSIMLKLSAAEVSLGQIGSKSGMQLLVAIPLSLLLFYVFPRIAPLWQIPSISKGTTGFNDSMSIGSISELFNDNSTAMQITFKDKPILNGYWQGVILNFYTGASWLPSLYDYASFSSVPTLKKNETPDYEIILEPDQKKWLFYTGYPSAGEPNFLFLPNVGLIRENKEPIRARFIYSLKVQSAPYHILSQSEYAAATQLPDNSNPRLRSWSKIQFTNAHNDINAFINFLYGYIHQQFWYTLTPPPLNSDRNKIDSFWFDTQKGYCEYYASAVTFILRAAGIPAHVIVGYQGGQWNPISNALTIKRSDAHAWLEYWQDGVGWRQLDPTAFIAPERIDQVIRNREIALNQDVDLNISELSWGRELNYILESVQFFSERWFLYYNPDSQQNLLRNVGLGEWDNVQLLQASVGCMIIFFILFGLYFQWRQKQTLDVLLLEYHLLQQEFHRFNISTQPPATLEQQCRSLTNKAPTLGPMLLAFIDRYEQLRLKQSDSKENKRETIALFKDLRRMLNSLEPRA